jgi:Flp pilus assembly protein TadG
MLRRLRRAVQAQLRKLRRADQGIAAIEFAFIAPVFLLMLGIMLESGLMAFTEFVLQSGVQRAAREVKTGVAQNAGYSAADFKNKICSLAGVIINCGQVYVYLKPDVSFNALNTSVPNPINVGPNYGGGGPVQNFNCGSPMQAMALIATYDWKFSIPYFMEPLGNVDGNKTRRLVGLSTFRNEPFPQSKSCS